MTVPLKTIKYNSRPISRLLEPKGVSQKVLEDFLTV
jgi:hypothetical protein